MASSSETHVLGIENRGYYDSMGVKGKVDNGKKGNY